MTSIGVLQIAIFFALILICTKPLGAFMAKVFEGQRTFLHPVLRWLEVLTYKLIGVKEDVEQRWTTYTAALLSFSIFGFLLTYLLQRTQGFLPFNPQHFNASNVPPDLAFNTATSFVTNTNWQAYSGESTMSYFVQMAALAVQNFASAAAGIAIAIAVVRGFSRQEKKTIGNFWVDVTRATVYVLLPISIIGGLLYVSQGAVQNLKPYTEVTTVEGAKQTIAQGPVASQEAIKQLGTNGGGFFNANSSHPFENPTPLSNLLAMFLIFVIPAALTYTFGKMVGDTRQGWAIFAAFSVMFLIGVFVVYHFEQAGQSHPGQHGGSKHRHVGAVRREHGGQGNPLRHCQLRAVRHGDHRRQLRCGEQHARQLHPAGRLGRDVQHHDGRGDLRRRRCRFIWDLALLHPGGIHRRLDGGSDA